MFNYFVSYAWETENRCGFGHVDVERNGKLVSIQDVLEIEEDISAALEEKVAILWFHQFPARITDEERGLQHPSPD